VHSTRGSIARTGINRHSIFSTLIWYCMMFIVLALPPVNREALQDRANEVAESIIQATILEHLVMEEVVSKPAGLLPCKRESES
jgi:hypothetical protein